MNIKSLYWFAYLVYHTLGQDRYPFKPLAEIKRDQSTRVRNMASYAFQFVPYYRETMHKLGLTPADFQCAADLEKLPFLEPSQLQRDPDYFLSKSRPKTEYRSLDSSGSTGKRRIVYHDVTSSMLNVAASERERCIQTRLIGKLFGYREMIMGSPTGATSKLIDFSRQNSFYPRWVKIERQYISVLDSPEVNLQRINAFMPDIINSYGSYSLLLFKYLRDNGLKIHPMKVFFFSSDGMPDSVRQIITQEYGMIVLSSYQAVEALKIGFECMQHSGYHLNIDYYPLRIIDANLKNVPVGEVGEVVISNLVNRGTVILNYRLGDLSALLENDCPCGRHLPLLSFPQGRRDDYVILPSGEIIQPQIIRNIFRVDQQILEFQVIQTAMLRFEVKMVVSNDCDRPKLQERIQAEFKNRFSQEVEVYMAFVDTLDRTEAGKFRTIRTLYSQQNRERDNDLQ